jgi:hypothetical protein
MVDLDSNLTKLIEVVEIGKQLLMTRGALTTFSIANDVAKYFAIIPAMFAAAFPVLNALNVMGLRTPQSAILSAVIFNALIIIALVPLALRGVKYRPVSAAALLRRNLLVYGLGGIAAPHYVRPRSCPKRSAAILIWIFNYDFCYTSPSPKPLLRATRAADAGTCARSFRSIPYCHESSAQVIPAPLRGAFGALPYGLQEAPVAARA